MWKFENTAIMLSLILTSSCSLEFPVAYGSCRKLGEGLGMRLCSLVPRLSVDSHQEPGDEAGNYDALVLLYLSLGRAVRSS